MASRYTLDAIDLDADGEQVWTRLYDGREFATAVNVVKRTEFQAAQYILSRWDSTSRIAPEHEGRRFKFDDERNLLSDELMPDA